MFTHAPESYPQSWGKLHPLIRILHTASASALLPLAVLAVQNVVIFGWHYFQDVIFPWDFSMSYYAIPAFWTTAIRMGVFPEWMPFQMMGYPMALNIQSGMYYPPLWLFPLLGIDYTLHAATVVQCLHVLAGSLGMYLFLKQVIKSPSYALIGAFIFQFFGGFYSNSQHVDIIRAYAIVPWLFYAFTLNSPTEQPLPRRFLLIPFLIYLMATGGYPGNLLSSALFIGFYALLQLIQAYFKRKSLKEIGAAGMWMAGLSGLGFAMAFAHLAPAWIEKDFMFRNLKYGEMERLGLWVEHLPGLFLTRKLIPGEPSMTSTYVTLPALIFASFASWKRIRQAWVYLLIVILGILMVPGDRSVVWGFVTSLLAPLKYSRFPSSDYRIFIAIPLILLAVLGLQTIFNKEISLKSVLFRVLFTAGWLYYGISLSYMEFLSRSALAVLVVVAGALILLINIWRRNDALTILPVIAILLLVSVDAWRVLRTMETWWDAEGSSLYSSRGWTLMVDGRLATHSSLANLPAQRPARTDKENPFDYGWEGYITGKFMLGDKTPCLLSACDEIIKNPVYKHYMLQEWSPILLDASLAQDGKGITVPEARLMEPASQAGNSVEQVLYGINEIVYQVSLSESKIMIENEVFFPGWEAGVAGGEQRRVLQAVPANGVFRAWILPAGEYTLKTNFHFPNLPAYLGVSILAWVLWAAVVIYARKHPGKWSTS